MYSVVVSFYLGLEKVTNTHFFWINDLRHIKTGSEMWKIKRSPGMGSQDAIQKEEKWADQYTLLFSPDHYPSDFPFLFTCLLSPVSILF